MAYATPAARNAAQRRWRTTDRAKRALQGICRDCPRTCKSWYGRQAARCAVCAMKEQQRRPNELETFNALKRALQAQAQAHFHPLRDDRRQNGKIAAGLAWSLQMRNA